MYRGKIFGREVEMQGSPYTLLVFKNEFEEDLSQHVDRLQRQLKENEVDIEGYLRVAWAMARTYDDKVDYYDRWLEEFPDEFDFTADGRLETFSVIVSAMNAELFRQEQSIRERIKRFIRRIKLRFGLCR